MAETVTIDVEHDESISPTRSLMAMIFGWLIIVPPFIAMYDTAKHVQALETGQGIPQTLEPALVIVIVPPPPPPTPV